MRVTDLLHPKKYSNEVNYAIIIYPLDGTML